MNVDQMKEHCQRMAGVRHELYGAPSNVLVYSVGDKNFACFKTNAPEMWRFSLRVSPDRFLELTDMPGVKPARYMARFHWVTIIDVQSFPEDYLIELLQWSWQKAFSSLSKAKQKSLGIKSD